MGFDLSQQVSSAKEQSFEPVPEGKYPLQCTGAKVIKTSGGSGQAVEAKFEITGESYAGRVIFHYFNIDNPNEKAVQIGLGQLKSFYKCAGVADDQAGKNVPDDLINLQAIANVGIQKGTNGYNDSNKIKNFNKSAGSIATKTAPSEDIPF